MCVLIVLNSFTDLPQEYVPVASVIEGHQEEISPFKVSQDGC
jgi:hypothetical protein